MKKRIRRAVTPGLPPGALPKAADANEQQILLEIVDYNHGSIERLPIEALPDNLNAPPEGTVRWLRISGVAGRSILSAIGSACGIHPLVLEDVASTEERIKTENYDSYTYTVLRTLRYAPGAPVRDVELDLLLTDTVLITVDEGETEGFFAPIFNRLENPDSLLRRGGVDLLYYAVVDLAVDCFFPLVESYERAVESLVQSISHGPKPDHIEAIHQLRAEIQHVRSTLWATRDVTAEIERSGVRGITEQTQFYFRDIHDHVIHLLDSVTNLRDSAGSLRELHMSGMSNRMNEIMKVLTIISTVFIPITFIAGIYGMNFVHMPELALRWAYPAVLGVMVAAIAGMLVFFKRRKWF